MFVRRGCDPDDNPLLAGIFYSPNEEFICHSRPCGGCQPLIFFISPARNRTIGLSIRTTGRMIIAQGLRRLIRQVCRRSLYLPVNLMICPMIAPQRIRVAFPSV